MTPRQIFGLQVLLSFAVYALDVHLGAAYFVPTFIVPALVVTHVMMFRMLVRHRADRPQGPVPAPRPR